MSLIIHSLLHSEWGFFPLVLAFLSRFSVNLDELDVIGNNLKDTPFDPFICFPLGMIQNSGNSYFSALVQMLLADL